MTYAITHQDVTNQDYRLFESISSGSKIIKTDLQQVWAWIISSNQMRDWIYPYQEGKRIYFSVNQFDSLTANVVYAGFKADVNSSIEEEVTEENIIMEMLKHDFDIILPPVEEYVMQVKIKNVEKAKPYNIEPEEI
ncbi:hypothetical protein ES703_67870 [subsurface metagenome]